MGGGGGGGYNFFDIFELFFGGGSSLFGGMKCFGIRVISCSFLWVFFKIWN